MLIYKMLKQIAATDIPGRTHHLFWRRWWRSYYVRSESRVHICRCSHSVQRFVRFVDAHRTIVSVSLWHENAHCNVQHDLSKIVKTQQWVVGQHERWPSGESSIERCKSIGFVHCAFTLSLAWAHRNGHRFVFSVLRNRLAVVCGRGHYVIVRSDARLSGPQIVRISLESCAKNGRTRSAYERDHPRHSGDKNVCLGTVVWQIGQSGPNVRRHVFCP